MLLYLVRHAQSENNAKPAYARIEDPPLTPVGQLQADHVAKWLATVQIDHLITSPFRRTIQTTKALLNIAPQPLSIWNDIFERGGCFRGHGPNATEGGPGMGRSEIQRSIEHDCVLDESIGESGWWGSKPRETDKEAIERGKQVHRRLIESFGQGQPCVVIITHADFKRILLKELMGDSLDVDSLGLLRNTGVTRLRLQSSTWELDWLNSVSHLPSKLITGKED